jgi:hypothetical protein
MKVFFILGLAIAGMGIYTFDNHFKRTAIARQNDLLSIAWLIEQEHEETGKYPESTLESSPEILHRMKRHERNRFSPPLRYRTSSKSGYILDETKRRPVNIYSSDRLILDGVDGLKWEISGAYISGKVILR